MCWTGQVSCSDFTPAACARAREAGAGDRQTDGAGGPALLSAGASRGRDKVSFRGCGRTVNAFNPVNTQWFLHFVCLWDREGD